MIHDVATSLKGPLRGVVHLWSLEEPDVREPSIDLNSVLDAGCRSVLSLVQALGTQGTAPRLWLVTRNAQPAGQRAVPLALTQAPLWGMGKVIALEHPELAAHESTSILPAPASDVDMLCELLLAPDDELEIAIRGSTRHVARLVRHVPELRPTAQGTRVIEEPMRVECTSPGVLDGLLLRRQSGGLQGRGKLKFGFAQSASTSATC